MPDDDMGQGDVVKGGGSFTNHTIDHLADAWHMSRKETMQHMIELLEQEIKNEH